MFRIILVTWILIKACDSSGGIRHQLRVADDKICEMLNNPTYATGGRILRTIKEFNEKVLQMSRQVENPKDRINPQKRIIRLGELVLKYKPKFITMKINKRKLKESLHWDDRTINYLKYLVQRAIKLRIILYKSCKRNYKYYQPQEYYEPKEDYQQQQDNEIQGDYEQGEYYKEDKFYEQQADNEHIENVGETYY